MTRESFEMRMVITDRSQKELRECVRERGIVNPTANEVTATKNHEDRTQRERRIWMEMDAVTAKWIEEVRVRRRAEAIGILKRRRIVRPEESEEDFRVILCEENIVCVYRRDGEDSFLVGFVNLETRGVVSL